MRTPPNDPLPDKPPAGATGPEGPPKEPAPPLSDNEIVEFAEVVASDHPEDSPVEVIELDAIELEEIELEEIDDDEVIEVAELADEEPAEAVDDAAAAPKGPPPLPEKATKKPRPPRQIALIGAGHAHLQVLKWWKRHPIPRAEVTLVTAFDHAAYSAMLPSTLASLYPPTEMLIDLPKLCDHCGVRLIVDRANRLDPNERTIEFAHQPALTFDVASVNIGSVPAAEPLWQSHRILISVKPLSTFLQRFDVRFRELVEQWKMAPGPELLQIIVVGAGATGVEMALCLEQHKHELELPADVRLVDGNNSVLTEFSPGAVRRVEKLLKLRGIDLSLGSPVVDCDDEGPGHLVLENGTRIRADLVIWAAGAAPPMALRGFELPKSANGFLAARPTLQTTANAPVFISGDAADFEDFTIPKAGVFATRQAGVLWRNLRSFLAKRPLADYRPQSHFMRILSCGDGTAVLDYKGFSFHSGWAWSLKKWMDQKWVKQFRV